MNRDDRARLVAITSMLTDLLEHADEREVSVRLPSKEQLVSGAKGAIRARRQRQELFPGIQVADPAWDLLLELLINSLEGRRISVTGLGLTANVPGATVLRWLAMFQESGLIVREPDPQDRRRVWVCLTPEGRDRVAQGLSASLDVSGLSKASQAA